MGNWENLLDEILLSVSLDQTIDQEDKESRTALSERGPQNQDDASHAWEGLHCVLLTRQ